MSNGREIPAKEATRVAESFIDLLSPYTWKIQIAGSLRRKHEYVHDIEIVAMGKERKTADLYTILNGESTSLISTHDRMMDLFKKDIINDKRPRKDDKSNPFGPRYYRINYIYDGREYALDFFVTLPPGDYYVNLLLRTGSKDFSYWIVNRSNRIRFRDGHLERDGVPFYVKSEKEIFDWLHTPYKEPWEREMI